MFPKAFRVKAINKSDKVVAYVILVNGRFNAGLFATTRKMKEKAIESVLKNRAEFSFDAPKTLSKKTFFGSTVKYAMQRNAMAIITNIEQTIELNRFFRISVGSADVVDLQTKCRKRMKMGSALVRAVQKVR